jgi:hypothetical protein
MAEDHRRIPKLQWLLHTLDKEGEGDSYWIPSFALGEKSSPKPG